VKGKKLTVRGKMAQVDVGTKKRCSVKLKKKKGLRTWVGTLKGSSTS